MKYLLLALVADGLIGAGSYLYGAASDNEFALELGFYAVWLFALSFIFLLSFVNRPKFRMRQKSGSDSLNIQSGRDTVVDISTKRKR